MKHKERFFTPWLLDFTWSKIEMGKLEGQVQSGMLCTLVSIPHWNFSSKKLHFILFSLRKVNVQYIFEKIWQQAGCCLSESATPGGTAIEIFYGWASSLSVAHKKVSWSALIIHCLYMCMMSDPGLHKSMENMNFKPHISRTPNLKSWHSRGEYKWKTPDLHD